MTLLHISNSIYTVAFARWLLKELAFDIYCQQGIYKLSIMQNKLNAENVFSFPVSLRKAMVQLSKCLRLIEVQSGWKIMLPNTIYYEHTNITLAAICNIANNGSLHISGIHNIDKLVSHYNAYLPKYFKRYELEVQDVY